MLKFDTSELDIISTPNIDYIGTVESTDESVEYKTYPIEVPREFMMFLLAMEYDDSKSVLQMQAAFARRYPLLGELSIEKNFLAPQKLNDRYVTQATLPEQVTKEDYIAGMCEIEKKVRARYNSADEADAASSYPVEVEVERRKQCHARMLKKRFVAECRKFLPAYGYQRALEKWHIRDRLNREVRMYSTDTIGWTTYNYVINRDICIQLDSNFGYGQSSYFLLSLQYKGIEIYPFSKYVRYPYANMRALIAHTRSYRVERESWPDALMFVAETANAAVQSPQTFVETFIGDEIGKMMAGLRDELRRQHFSETVSGCRDDRPQYLGVSVKGQQTFQFEASPDEMLLARKAERIIGALAVLEKLKAFDAIVANVTDYINELVKMVVSLIPELDKAIRSVLVELKCCESEFEFLKAIYACCQAEVTRHELALKEKRDEAIAKMSPDILWRERNSILCQVRCAYEYENREWQHVLSVRNAINRELSSFRSHISRRNLFLDVIKKCYGVGRKGEHFWHVVEKLYPHEVEIENEVRRRVKELSGKNMVRGIDGIREVVRAKYREVHKDVDSLFKERDAVLDVIDTFTYSKVGK